MEPEWLTRGSLVELVLERLILCHLTADKFSGLLINLLQARSADAICTTYHEGLFKKLCLNTNYLSRYCFILEMALQIYNLLVGNDVDGCVKDCDCGLYGMVCKFIIILCCYFTLLLRSIP